MKLKNKTDKLIQGIIDKVSNNSVSQDETGAQGEKAAFGNMGELIRRAAADSIVMLKNDNSTLPYSKDTVVSVFGRCQYDYFYVGYGSGGDVNAPYTVNLLDGMRNCGIKINEELAEYYGKWREKNPVSDGFWGHWPMCYEEAVLDSFTVKKAAQNSDTALVVIGRAAGEDRENTLEKGSYYLNDEEISLLDSVTSAFDSVTVLMDCGNIIDMSKINEYGDKISAILYVWQGGMESGNAVADVLCGNVTPSGKLVDTIAASYDDYPSAKHFGNKDFNEYTEDIYVGYRYFETFAPDKALYPFGFGLSYTDFEIKCKSFKTADGKVTVKVSVKNTGEYAGKEVVQLYVSAPQGRLGKAKYSLIAFGKTKELAPKEKQEIELCADYYSFASFDDTGAADMRNSYVLEEGEYKFFAGDGIRELEEIGAFTLESDVLVEKLECICPVHDGFDRITAFEFEGALIPKKARLSEKRNNLASRILKAIPEEIGYDSSKSYNLSQVADGEITLDEFISCLTNEELEGLTRGEGYMNSELGVAGNAGAFGGTIPSLRDKGVLPIITTDGPAGIRVSHYTSLLPCGTALASTWDTELVYELCEELGKELVYQGSDVLLAPGMNIHRNPLCGRNFEYFSEDPLISGRFGAAYVRGIQASGASACPKHFACNNQEVNRIRNDSRISQRALREIYLKGFEICVKEAKPLNIMTSYNKINGVWSHYNFDLVTTVLRGEWGFDGSVMTDWWMRSSKSPEFPNLRDNAYRVRSQVDVYMPGDKSRTAKKYNPDKTLLETVGMPDGLTRAELERTAKNVLGIVLKLKYSKAE
jgi:beta-glucosidase